MDSFRNLARNTFSLLIGYVISYALSIISTIYIATYLGVSNFGILSFGIAFTGIFAFIGDLGLQTLLIKEIARDKSTVTKYFGNANVLKLILAFITTIAILVFINVLDYPQDTRIIVYILGISIAIQVYTQLYYSLFQAYEHMEFVSVSQIVTSTCVLLGALIAINNKLGLIHIASIYLIANVLSLLFCMAVTYFKFKSSPFKLTFIELDIQYCKSILKKAIPYSLITIFVMTYFYADTVILSVLRGDESVGLFSAAYKLALIPISISTVCSSALLPVMSRLSIISHSQMAATFKRYIKYMMILSIPIGVGITMLASRFMTLIYGAKFMDGSAALQVLIWSTVFIFLNGSFGPLIYSINKQGFATKAAGICALFNVLGNLVAISFFDYMGASYIKAATELLMLVLVFIFCAKLEYVSFSRDIWRSLIISLSGSAVMGITIWLLYSLNIVALIAISALVYFIVMFILRIFDQEDLDLVKQLISMLRKKDSASL